MQTAYVSHDSKAWKVQVWASFAISIGPSLLGVSWRFLISSVFTLAKTLRDTHEALLFEVAARRRHADGAST